MLAFGLSQVLRFGSSLVMTRLLLPEAFGVMAIVVSVISGLSLFSDLGIRTSIIQNARGAEVAFRNTAWTMQIIRSALLCVLAIVCAPLFGAAYPLYSGLTILIQAAAFGTLIDGFGGMAVVLLDRRLDVARKALIDLASQAITITSMIVWAMCDPTPWAFVGGSLIGSAAQVLIGYALCGTDRMGWDRQSVKALLAWGKWSFISSGMMFLAGQADRLMFGALVPAAMLGVYGLALQLACLAPELVNRLFLKVVFPVLCRMSQLREPLSEVFVSCSRPVMVVGGWGLAGVIGGGDLAVQLLYRDEYSDAGWITQILASGLWFGAVLHGSRSSALISSGKLRRNTVVMVAKLVSMLVLMPIGWLLAEFPGAVIGFALADVCKYVTSMVVCAPLRLDAWRAEFRLTSWVALSAVVGWGSAQVAGWLGMSLVWQCTAVFLAVSLVWWNEMLPVLRGARLNLSRTSP
jgi:O-antigen/teichoic acid export membrane protein